MNKQISILSEKYESNVDTISEVDGEIILKTNNDRFFKIGPDLAKIIQMIQHCELPYEAEKEIAETINKVLIPKGILTPLNLKEMRVEKAPTLQLHKRLFKRETVDLIVKYITWLLSPYTAFPIMLAIIIINNSFIMENLSGFSYKYIFSFNLIELTSTIVLTYFCLIIHEFGHATACKRYSGRVGEIGFGINFIFPVFYANVSNIHTIKKSDKIKVAISGVYFQLQISTVIILAYYAFDLEFLAKFIILNYISIAITLIPFFKNDGYWILCDTFGNKNLIEDTYKRIISKEKMKLENIIYTLTFIPTFIIVFILSIKFAFITGPIIISSFSVSEINFTEFMKLLLTLSHYLAILIGIYLLISKSMYSARMYFKKDNKK